MPVCVFFGCNSGSKKVCLKNTGICLHRFPKDPKFRSIWQQQIQEGHNNNSKPINFNSAVVCSLHFGPYYYNNNDMLPYNLKFDAVPLNSSGIDFNVQENSVNEANRNTEHRKNEIVLKNDITPIVFESPQRSTTPALSPIKTPARTFSVELLPQSIDRPEVRISIKFSVTLFGSGDSCDLGVKSLTEKYKANFEKDELILKQCINILILVDSSEAFCEHNNPSLLL